MYIKITKNDKLNLKGNINKYRDENLLNRVVITSIYRPLRTVSEQLNRYDKTKALFYERFSIEFM